MTFNIDFDPELYTDVLAIRQEIKDLKVKAKHTEDILKENGSKLFRYNKMISVLKNVLINDSYKEMNEGIEKDEKFEKENR